MDTRDFGAFLSRIRKARGLTQAGLAEQLHVTDKAVSRWERGIGLPDINTLEPLADALGLSLSDLMHCHDPEQDRETTATPRIPPTLCVLKETSSRCSADVERLHFTTRLISGLRSL